LDKKSFGFGRKSKTNHKDLPNTFIFHDSWCLESHIGMKSPEKEFISGHPLPCKLQANFV